MALNIDAVQASAKAQTVRTHGNIGEGEVLLAIVPVYGVQVRGSSRKDGIPWTTVEVMGGNKAYNIFKRPVMTLDQAYCQDDLFVAAALAEGAVALDEQGNPIIEDGKVTFNLSSVTHELVKSEKMTQGEVNDARTEKFAWVCAKIAWRRDDKMPWVDSFEKTQVFTVSEGSGARPAPHRIILKAITDDPDGVLGNMDAYFDARLIGGAPDAPTIKLVRVTRTGMTQTGSAYGGGVVNESDVKSNPELYDYVPSSIILDDMFEAVQPGAYANPHTYAVQSALPSRGEIDRKVYDKEKASDRPEMGE